jgi:hypothetical protein
MFPLKARKDDTQRPKAFQESLRPRRCHTTEASIKEGRMDLFILEPPRPQKGRSAAGSESNILQVVVDGKAVLRGPE